LSYFCPIFVLSTYFEPIRSKFCPYFVLNFCLTFVLFLSYFCLVALKFSHFVPPFFIEGLGFAYFVLFLSYFCPYFVLLLSLFLPKISTSANRDQMRPFVAESETQRDHRDQNETKEADQNERRPILRLVWAVSS
jgi:hypothetical protein